MNFYKHHLGDYAAGTSHLSWDEDCAYRRLIDQYYKREAPIPADLKEACRLVRAQTPAQKRAVEAVLQEFFNLTDDGWHQKRCDAELYAANAQADTNRRIAEEREAKKRARKEHESLYGSSNGALNESYTNRSPAPVGEREPSQTPDSRLQTPLPLTPPVGRFDEFWAAWPKSERKQDKAKCADKWRKASLDLAADRIIADVALKQHTEKWRGGFVEAPLVYLNGRRWEDGVEPQGTAAGDWTGSAT